MHSNTPPVILSLSAMDPSGCGGIQADIETAASLGCHCAPIATALCTTGVSATAETLAVDSTIIIEQARSILEDMPVKAIKIGFVGSVANAEAIHTILQDYSSLPVVIHPALCLWDEEQEEQADLPSAIASLLLPCAKLLISSYDEACALIKPGDTRDATAQALFNEGCSQLLLTQTHASSRKTESAWYDKSGLIQSYDWPQAAPTCHGSASTLASAASSFLAHGSSMQSALEQGQNFTWQAISAARQLGFGKPTPHRFFWADENIDQPEQMPAGSPSH